MTFDPINSVAHREHSREAWKNVAHCIAGVALATAVATTCLFISGAPLYATVIAYAVGVIWLSLAIAATIKAIYHLYESHALC